MTLYPGLGTKKKLSRSRQRRHPQDSASIFVKWKGIISVLRKLNMVPLASTVYGRHLYRETASLFIVHRGRREG